MQHKPWRRSHVDPIPKGYQRCFNLIFDPWGFASYFYNIIPSTWEKNVLAVWMKLNSKNSGFMVCSVILHPHFSFLIIQGRIWEQQLEKRLIINKLVPYWVENSVSWNQLNMLESWRYFNTYYYNVCVFLSFS